MQTPSSNSSFEIVVDSGDGNGVFEIGDALTVRLKDASALRIEAPPPPPEDSKDQPRFFFKQAENGLMAVPLASGDLEIPSFAVKNQNGEAVGATRPMSLVVQALPQEKQPPSASEEAAADEKAQTLSLFPMAELAYPKTAWIVGGSLGLLSAALAAWFLVRKLGRKPVAPTRPDLTEDQEAIEALVWFRNKAWWKEGSFKPHYFGVSEVLKRYLTRRYRIPGLEATTRELLDQIERTDLSAGLKRNLRDLFERLDLVKFTDASPESGDPEAVLDDAQKFIEMTRKTLQPSSAGASPKQAGKGEPRAVR